jgi:hypothetical protein
MGVPSEKIDSARRDLEAAVARLLEQGWSVGQIFLEVADLTEGHE